MAVGRKFADDEGGNLTALIAYRAFFSLFPLLLLLTSVLGFVLAGDPSLRKEAIDSVLGQFPVVGEQIRVGTLEGSGVALAVGIVGSLWAGLGVVLATGEALDRIWEVPRGERQGFLSSRLRSLAMLAVLGTLTLVSTIASGLVGGGSVGAAWGVTVSAGAQPARLRRRLPPPDHGAAPLAHDPARGRRSRRSGGRSCSSSAATSSSTRSRARPRPTAPSPW